MKRSVHVDDSVRPALDTLAQREREKFDRLVQHLEEDGIEGLSRSDVKRLPEGTIDTEDGPVWVISMGRYRAFVAERGGSLHVLDVVPQTRLQKWNAARSRQ